MEILLGQLRPAPKRKATQEPLMWKADGKPVESLLGLSHATVLYAVWVGTHAVVCCVCDDGVLMVWEAKAYLYTVV